MRNVVALLILLALGWYGYSQYQRRTDHSGAPDFPPPLTRPLPVPETGPSAALYKCDGRIYCSQMTSCAEATYFLQNCPGTKMDGNNDGIPCEKQWCK
jgi:Excalibur calcium-binding domain